MLSRGESVKSSRGGLRSLLFPAAFRFVELCIDIVGGVATSFLGRFQRANLTVCDHAEERQPIPSDIAEGYGNKLTT